MYTKLRWIMVVSMIAVLFLFVLISQDNKMENEQGNEKIRHQEPIIGPESRVEKENINDKVNLDSPSNCSDLIADLTTYICDERVVPVIYNDSPSNDSDLIADVSISTENVFTELHDDSPSNDSDLIADVSISTENVFTELHDDSPSNDSDLIADVSISTENVFTELHDDSPSNDSDLIADLTTFICDERVVPGEYNDNNETHPSSMGCLDSGIFLGLSTDETHLSENELQIRHAIKIEAHVVDEQLLNNKIEMDKKIKKLFDDFERDYECLMSLNDENDMKVKAFAQYFAIYNDKLEKLYEEKNNRDLIKAEFRFVDTRTNMVTAFLKYEQISRRVDLKNKSIIDIYERQKEELRKHSYFRSKDKYNSLGNDELFTSFFKSLKSKVKEYENNIKHIYTHILRIGPINTHLKEYGIGYYEYMNVKPNVCKSEIKRSLVSFIEGSEPIVDSLHRKTDFTYLSNICDILLSNETRKIYDIYMDTYEIYLSNESSLDDYISKCL